MQLDARPQLPIPQNKNWLWPVGLSVLVHGLVLYFFQGQTSSVPTFEEKPAAIQARLYFPPAPAVEPEPVVETAPEVSEPEPVVEEAPPAPQEAPAEPVETVEAPPPTTAEVTAQPEPVVSAPVNTPSEPAPLNQDAIWNGYTHGSLDTLRKIQQQKDFALGADAATMSSEQYRQSRVRPADVPQLSEDEELIKQTEIRANCDKGINQQLAWVGGFLGANIKCSPKDDFQRYIDKRINKQPAN